MRRLLRSVLRILKWAGLGLSTLLFVTAIALWARSCGHSDHVAFRRGSPATDRGYITMNPNTPNTFSMVRQEEHWIVISANGLLVILLHVYRDSATGQFVVQGPEPDFWLPYWMPATLFALWPLFFTACRLLRKKRYSQGLCPACGYDLRATPDPSGPRLARCPECGRVNTQSSTGV